MRLRRLLICLASTAVTAAVMSALSPAPANASLAWADDPCEENGGQVAVAPDVAVAPADDHPLAYVACADGALLYHGEYGKGSNERIPGVDADQFVDVASTMDGMYAVTATGRIVTTGYAPHYGDLYPTTGVVALETTPSGGGYWIVTKTGRVYGFGDANNLGPRRNTVVHSAVVAFAASDQYGGWLVTALGEIVPVGDAPNFGSVATRVASGDRVVGIVTDYRTGGFWVVTRDGDILEAGGAPAEYDTASCLSSPGGQPPFTGAVADPDPMSAAPLWIYSANGGICGFNPQ